jgi:hypothetical protein
MGTTIFVSIVQKYIIKFYTVTTCFPRFLREVLEHPAEVSKAFDADKDSPLALLSHLRGLLATLVDMAFPPGTIIPEALETLPVKKFTHYVPCFDDNRRYELLTSEEAEARIQRRKPGRDVSPLKSYVEVLQARLFSERTG